MKNNLLRNSVVFIVCLLLAMFAVCNVINIATAAEPTEPHPANALWTEPSTMTIDNTTVEIGYRFNVTVWLNATDFVFTWQTKLLFNPTYFEALRTDYTGVGKSEFFTGHSTIPVVPVIDNTTGFVLSGESLLVDFDVTGYGSLIWVEFNLTRIPPQNQLVMNFSNIDTFVLDPDLEDLTMDIISGTDIPVIPEFPHILMLLIVTAFSAVPVILKKKLRL